MKNIFFFKSAEANFFYQFPELILDQLPSLLDLVKYTNYSRPFSWQKWQSPAETEMLAFVYSCLKKKGTIVSEITENFKW